MNKSAFKSDAAKRAVQTQYQELLKSWPAIYTQRTVDSDLGETFVIESGDNNKPALVLLHGSVANSITWMRDVEFLSEHYHVFAIDLPGEPGLTVDKRPEYNGGCYASWLNSVLDSLNLNKVFITGLSLGGWMALDFATQFPNRVNALYLIAPGGLGKTKGSFIWKALWWTLQGRAGKQKMIRMLNGGQMLQSDDKENNNQAISKGITYTMGLRQHVRPRTGQLPIFSEGRLKLLTMPVCVVFGDYDIVVDAPSSLRHAQKSLPNAEIIELPKTGHVIVGQAKKMHDFFNKNAPAS